MEESKGKDCRQPVNPERKYIRIQTVGMAFVLAWPVAMILADMYDLAYIIPHMSVLMLIVGIIIFFIGHVGRQELAQHKAEKGDK